MSAFLCLKNWKEKAILLILLQVRSVSRINNERLKVVPFRNELFRFFRTCVSVGSK
jgi:hypothetical protein